MVGLCGSDDDVENQMREQWAEQNPFRPGPPAIVNEALREIESEQHHRNGPAVGERLVVNDPERLKRVTVAEQRHTTRPGLLGESQQNEEQQPGVRIANSN